MKEKQLVSSQLRVFSCSPHHYESHLLMPSGRTVTLYCIFLLQNLETGIVLEIMKIRLKSGGINLYLSHMPNTTGVDPTVKCLLTCS